MDYKDFSLILFAQVVQHETLEYPGEDTYIIEKLDRKKQTIRFSRQPLDPKTNERRQKQYFLFHHRFLPSSSIFGSKSLET